MYTFIPPDVQLFSYATFFWKVLQHLKIEYTPSPSLSRALRAVCHSCLTTRCSCYSYILQVIANLVLKFSVEVAYVFEEPDVNIFWS